MKACKNHGKIAIYLFFLFSTIRKKLKDKKCSELAALRDIFIAVYMSTKDSTADAKYVSTSSLKAAKTIIFFGTKMQVNYSNIEGCQTKQISIAKQSSFYHVTTRKRSIARRLKLKLPHSAISIQ
jgi:hypothetical protein